MGTMIRVDQDLPCNELVEIVTEYFEDALAQDRRANLEHHLGQCPGCVAYVERMRTVIALTAKVGITAPATEPERERALEAFRASAPDRDRQP